MGTTNGYTPTEGRILNLLKDGRRHSRFEIQKCLDDPLSPVTAIRFHISIIRKKLPAEETIVCELFNGAIHYRHIRLLIVGQKEEANDYAHRPDG